MEDEECNDREEQRHDPECASQQAVKWAMKTKEEERREREVSVEMVAREEEAVNRPEVKTQETRRWEE